MILLTEIIKPDSNKQNIASKLHRQFAHASSSKIKALLTDANIHDDEIINQLEILDTTCDTCLKYKKKKPKPIVGLPLAKTFNETVAMDLKEWSHQPTIWFLHMIDHFSQYSVSCVIHSKRKEVIVDKILKHWIATFGHPHKFLTDNGGEFCNDEFISLCENFNIRVCTTAAESPWSNGLVERHNGILGLMVPKVIENCNCSLETALAWSVSAKNSLANVHGYSSNQLVFGKNPNYPNALEDKLPALEASTCSEIVAKNLNACRYTLLDNNSFKKNLLTDYVVPCVIMFVPIVTLLIPLAI